MNDRIALIRRELERGGLDALLCTLPSEVLMLSGYWPVVGTAVAIANREGRVVVIAPEDEAELAMKGWAEVRTFSPASVENLSTAAKALVKPLRKLFSESTQAKGGHGWGTRMGYGAGPTSEPASYSAMNIYGAAVPEILLQAGASQIVDAHDAVARLKQVKTPYEVLCISSACDVACDSFTEASRSVRVGMKEVEVAAMFRALLASKTSEQSERCDGFAYCMSGANAAQASGAYARSRTRNIAAGDLVLVHCNSYVDGYWTDITRTYCIGKPDQKQREMYEAVFAARDAALAAIRPGARGSDVDAAAREVLAGRGYGDHFPHSTGHGVGFSAIEANAMPRLHPKSPDVLETGMTFNLEPAIYIEGYGAIRHCDMVAVTEDGFELLTDFQTSLDDLVLPGGGESVVSAA